MTRANQIGQRAASQFNATFETDGEQQKDAQRLIKHARYLQIRTYHPGKQAKNEEQDDGFERHTF